MCMATVQLQSDSADKPAARTAQGILTTLEALGDTKQSRENKSEEQQSLKRRRDMAHVVLKRAKRDGGPDDVRASE